MIRKAVLLWLATAFGLGLMLACGSISPASSFAATHPQELGPGRPQCTSCHADAILDGAQQPYSAFDHTPSFVKDHRFLAGRDANVCAACHAPSFCADCHSGKTLITPDVKLGNRPDRDSPHRADYITVHRFDGQADPTSCFKCHGRADNEQCLECHNK